MTRPCFLVVDREFASSISTRKLVIETAKFNVITAYSGTEALDTLQRFPKLDGIVMDVGMKDVPCAELVRRIKKMDSKIPVVVVGRPGSDDCSEADYSLTSFDPTQVLGLLKKLVPQEAAAIERHNQALDDRG